MARFLKTVLVLICLLAPTGSALAQPLTIATIERKPFAFETDEGWDGFSIELWQAIAQEIGATTSFTSAAGFTELLDLVETGMANAAIANISITSAREARMDFSQPIFDSGLIVLSGSGSDSNIFSILLSKSLLMWLAGASVVLLIAANLIYFFERRVSDAFDGGYWKGLGEGLWWAMNAILDAGFEIASPSSRAGRILAFALVLVGLFVVGAFVAQITAALTVNQLQSQIAGYEDLYDKRVGTTSGSTSASFLTARSIRFTGYDSLDETYAALEAGDIDAIVHDAPILSYYAQTAGRGRFRTVGRIFNPEKYGVALPTDSPLREDINRALLLLRENGTHAGLVEKWFGQDY